MFSTVSRFLSRNKNKFLITGVLVGGTILATRYARRKLREWQEKQSLEFIERRRQSQHFDSTENTCNQTIFSLAPSVCEAVFKTLVTEEIIADLKKHPENKVILWEKLKVQACTKVSSIVYAYAMLVIILRIQLNLIGGYMYKDSKNNVTIVDSDLQERYLSLCHYLFDEGIKNICAVIEDNVNIVVSAIPLNRMLTLSDIEQIFWSIQAAISKDNRNPIQNMEKFVLPKVETNNSILKTMIQETKDLIETDDVQSLLTSSISRGFATVMDQIAEYFVVQQNASKITEIPVSANKTELNSFVNVNHVSIPTAKIIPILNGLMSQPDLRLSKCSEVLLQHLMLNERIKILGANIYETFSH